MVCFESEPFWCERLKVNVKATGTGADADEAWADLEQAVVKLREKTAPVAGGGGQ